MNAPTVKPRILFILKSRSVGYSTYSGESKSSGLWNSANFVRKMLDDNNFDVKLVDVDDNNSIDREVTLYKPTHVIIEALFVVPSKFEILTKLHPTVKWIVRIHSEVSFISTEGIFGEWIHQYVKYPNVSIAPNSKRMKTDLETLLEGHEIGYLPNYYEVAGDGISLPEEEKELYELNNNFDVDKSDDIINVCCFGAIRPLKNQLQQAISAIKFANDIGKTLHFHINGTRVENQGDATIKNIIQLFENNFRGHKLVMHGWLPHKNFISLLKLMDIGMQVSFTETYNIVAADMIAAGIPIVTSPEVMFVSRLFQADPTDTNDITNKLQLAWKLRKIHAHKLNRYKLDNDAEKALCAWMRYFR